MQQTTTPQQVVGDTEHEHMHPPVVHVHDHYHVSHHQAGGPFGDFEHRSHYHQHEHNHTAIVHAHKKLSEEDELKDHASTGHIHDHNAPTGGGY
jgi:hypothetical protein